jgi:hypothetical protein
MADTPHVYTAICAVTAALSVEGIGKDRKNDQQGFRFRGIDDVYNALAPVLAQHKLAMLPRVTDRVVVERTTAKGGTLFVVTVGLELDLVSAVDGSRHTIRTYGEAMDSADKATNKAMAAAFKYAAFMAFCIPTEGSGHDADEETTPPVKPRPDMVATGRHPSFTDAEGRDFAIGLGKLGVTYDVLAEWLERGEGHAAVVLETLELPKSRPSQWAKRYRQALYAMIAKDAPAFIRMMQGGGEAYGS